MVKWRNNCPVVAGRWAWGQYVIFGEDGRPGYDLCYPRADQRDIRNFPTLEEAQKAAVDHAVAGWRKRLDEIETEKNDLYNKLWEALK